MASVTRVPELAVAVFDPAHLRLSRVTIKNLPWQDVIRRYDMPGTLIFLDPPYWQTSGYAGECGLEEHMQLAQAMSTMKGKALLTINDHHDMHATYGGMRSTSMQTSYTISGGDTRKDARELLYRSWPS